MKEKRCRSGSWAVVWLPVLLAASVIVVSACRSATASRKAVSSTPQNIPIKHVIIIFQENRSFDSYFGTFPGADGIPMRNGVPSVCVPDPTTGQCVKPYPDHDDVNCGGPHEAAAAVADVADGKMNGFIREVQAARSFGFNPRGYQGPLRKCLHPTDPKDSDPVMGYHTGGDIPNYWAYAKNFVLQDHMFESVHSWSFPSHLFLVSAWAANCGQAGNPMSCVSALQPNNRTPKKPTPFAWTDLTYLLYKAHVSWVYYLDHGALSSSSGRGKGAGAAAKTSRKYLTAKEASTSGVPTIWNVLPGFTDVHEDNQLASVEDLGRFFAAAKAGTLPSVSWISPNRQHSEHPPGKVSAGESYVTRIVNAAMQSPDWKSTAIFVTWDDWGGFYDHVVPPRADSMGYGIRVPAFMVSPYARRGYIDHQTLSYDAYIKFIEDVFLRGQRLNPKTDGRPDSRPYVRENSPVLGNLMKDFDFSQPPRRPMLLPVHPKTTLVEDQ